MTVHCPSCGDEDPTVSITINNSQSEYWSQNSNGICENDVTFDVSFPEDNGNEDDLTSVRICEECYQNNEYLTDEYIAQNL